MRLGRAAIKPIGRVGFHMKLLGLLAFRALLRVLSSARSFLAFRRRTRLLCLAVRVRRCGRCRHQRVGRRGVRHGRRVCVRGVRVDSRVDRIVRRVRHGMSVRAPVALAVGLAIRGRGRGRCKVRMRVEIRVIITFRRCDVWSWCRRCGGFYRLVRGRGCRWQFWKDDDMRRSRVMKVHIVGTHLDRRRPHSGTCSCAYTGPV